MSITSSLEPFMQPRASISASAGFFEPEEKTLVPSRSLGYSHPPISRSDGAPERAALLAPDASADDEALFDAAIGAHRRRLLLLACAAGGLTIGAIAAMFS